MPVMIHFTASSTRAVYLFPGKMKYVPCYLMEKDNCDTI